MGLRQRRQWARRDDETLEAWLRRRAAEPAGGIPIDPRMTLDLYDKVAALENRIRELEAREAPGAP